MRAVASTPSRPLRVRSASMTGAESARPIHDASVLLPDAMMPPTATTTGRSNEARSAESASRKWRRAVRRAACRTSGEASSAAATMVAILPRIHAR
jgi:hypothetical protein